MTGDELRAWARRCGLTTDTQAAAAMRIGVSTYRRKRHGRLPISQRDELIAALYELHAVHWLAIAEACRRIAILTEVPIPPAAVDAVAATLAKMRTRPTSRR